MDNTRPHIVFTFRGRNLLVFDDQIATILDNPKSGAVLHLKSDTSEDGFMIDQTVHEYLHGRCTIPTEKADAPSS